MPELYGFELTHAALKLCRDLLKLKKDEIVVMTCDTESNQRTVEAVASAAFAMGAKPMVVWNATPLGVGKAADSYLPKASLVGALNAADVWIEFNNQWIFYSATYDAVVEDIGKLRYLNLVGMNPSMLVRVIGRVDLDLLEKYLARISSLTVAAKEIHMTTPAGTDVTFKNKPNLQPRYSLGYADKPGIHMLGGQIGWGIEYETINGKIVFDGSVNPPTRIGLIRDPIELTVVKGDIIKFDGGSDAIEGGGNSKLLSG